MLTPAAHGCCNARALLTVRPVPGGAAPGPHSNAGDGHMTGKKRGRPPKTVFSEIAEHGENIRALNDEIEEIFRLLRPHLTDEVSIKRVDCGLLRVHGINEELRLGSPLISYEHLEAVA